MDDQLHQLYNAARREDLRIPNALWDELRRASPEVVTAINEARRRIQNKGQESGNPASPVPLLKVLGEAMLSVVSTFTPPWPIS